MCKHQLCNTVFIYLVGSDKLKSARTFIIIEKVRVQACMSRIYIERKHCAVTKITAVSKTKLYCLPLSGYLIYNILRNGGCSHLHRKIHIICVFCRYIPAVYRPDDSVAHIKGNGDILSFYAVQNISGYHFCAIHDNMKPLSFRSVCGLVPDSRPALFAGFTGNRWNRREWSGRLLRYR